MNIDDEIRRKKQSMQAAVDAEAKRQADAKRLSDAFRAAGMSNSTPILRMPSQDLQAVITETMPRMTFNSPKIIRSMPDGTTRVRAARNDQDKRERADDYSFDVTVKKETIDKSNYHNSIWFFKNGSVAFTRGTYGDDNIDNPGVTASQVREKIIETIANSQVVRPKSQTNQSQTSSKQSSGGCYIATAVYGSYDCPEVWILRRYRDYTLRPTWYGKLFIKLYYALSPSLVKWFGEKNWFQCFWRKRLDSLTDDLQRKGFSNKPYDD